MEGRWTVVNGRLTKQQHQNEAEIQDIVDTNHYIKNHLARGIGGAGSDNQRWVARVPSTLRAQLIHEWRLKGGLAGTEMKADEYVLLNISRPEFTNLVVTPSGKTGLESRARRKTFGHVQNAAKRQRQTNKRPQVEFVGF